FLTTAAGYDGSMRPLLLLVLAAPLVTAGPGPRVVARLGDDRFRQAGRVECLAYSPDGKRLASADGSTVLVWDATTGRVQHRTPLGNREVKAVGFTRDGREVLAVAVGRAAQGTSLVRIDPATGTAADDRRVFERNGSVALSPDGAWLAVRDDDGAQFRLIDTATGRQPWPSVGRDDRFHSFAFRPDGRAVAAGTLGGRVTVYDLASGKPLHEYRVRGGSVWNMAYSPDGKDLVAEVSSPDPNRVVRFDAATGRERWQYRTARANDLAFTAAGTLVRFQGEGARESDPRRWYLLDANTALPAGPPLDPGPVAAVARHPDGRTLAFGDYHGLISQWDEPTGKRLKASADPPTVVRDLYFSPDGTKVRGWARGWYEWDVATGKQVRQSPPILEPAAVTVAGSRDLRWIAVEKPVTGGFLIELRDQATGSARTFPDPYRTGSSMRFLPTGRLLVREQDWWAVLDPDGGAAVRIPPHRRKEAIAATDDGTLAVHVAVGPAGVRLDRYDLRTGRPLGTWTGPVPDIKPSLQTAAWGATVSPDGGVLLVTYTHLAQRDITSAEGFALDPVTGRHFGSASWVYSGTTLFRPDGRSFLQWWGQPATCQLRETWTGEVRARTEFPRPVREARYHPDGRRLAVSTGPHPVEIWDLFGDPGPWDATAADALWAALADPDAEKAFAAVRRVWAHPAAGVPFLKDRVRVMPAISDEWLAARLRGVDAKAFRDREQASADLAAVAELVVGRLTAALPTASAEARVRIEAALKAAGEVTPDKLRNVRACEALEGAGTPEAVAELKVWAAGPAEATLTREAKASVARLSRR
ncbi:MAG TPA: WD40 repeat domain-containing protein, partial [Gemmataceae bacterium]|nr:WD40 repeat domain-containing protein [Gemmataceae bacterium]